MWQGPAQTQDFSPLYVHYNWYWFWRYGNGDIGNQGVHQMDLAAWGINKGLPIKIESSGRRYTYQDGTETPNTQTSTFTYADGTITVFEVRGRSTNAEAGTKIGNLFYGSDGYFARGEDFSFFDKEDTEIPMPDIEVPASRGRFGNFLRAVRSRKVEENFAPASAGHIAAAHCPLANVAFRVGHTVHFDPHAERFQEGEANRLLKRDYRDPFAVPQIA